MADQPQSARETRERERGGVRSHHTMAIYPLCSRAPARPPPVPSLCQPTVRGAIRGPALPQRNKVHQPAGQRLQVGTLPTGVTAVEDGMLIAELCAQSTSPSRACLGSSVPLVTLSRFVQSPHKSFNLTKHKSARASVRGRFSAPPPSSTPSPMRVRTIHTGRHHDAGWHGNTAPLTLLLVDVMRHLHALHTIFS